MEELLFKTIVLFFSLNGVLITLMGIFIKSHFSFRRDIEQELSGAKGIRNQLNRMELQYDSIKELCSSQSQMDLSTIRVEIENVIKSEMEVIKFTFRVISKRLFEIEERVKYIEGKIGIKK